MLKRVAVSPRISVVSRRAFVSALAAVLAGLTPRSSFGFGQAGTFRVRRITTGVVRSDATRDLAASRWAWELIQRTSASARLDGLNISAHSSVLLDEPFAVWCGTEDPGSLTNVERRSIERFLRLGGLLVVDDANPVSGAFLRGARRELASLVLDSPIQVLSPTHVLFKSFYLLSRPVGRFTGSGKVEAINRGRYAQVLFFDCDLMGALATRADGKWALEMANGAARQREDAVRLAVNVAMYLLCSDYKDDQVHAAWLMRHRMQIRK